MPVVGDPPGEDEVHEFLRRGRHAGEALPKGHDREAHAVQVLRHLDRAPPVEGDLLDVELLAELADELLNEPVVDDVPLGGLQEPLLLPEVVWDVVLEDPLLHVLLGYPEIREHVVDPVGFGRREHEHEGGDVGGAREVEPTVARPPPKLLRNKVPLARVPLFHRHPTDRLLHPLVKPQLAEGVLLGGVLPRGLEGRLHLVWLDGDAQGRVGLPPHLGVGPVVLRLRPVDDGVERRVGLPPLEYVLGLLVRLVADAVDVGPGRGDQEVERLRSRVAAALRHDVEELPVGLGVQLVEDDPVDVEAVLRVSLGGQHLVEAVRRDEDDPLVRGEDPAPLAQRRAHTDHVGGHLEDDRGLLSVGGAAVYLGPLLAVPAKEVQRDGRRELGLPLLLGDLDVGRVELSVAVRLNDAEDVPDDLLLPVDELEPLPRPHALRVTQALYEGDGVVGRLFVVARVLGLELSGLVLLQLSHRPSPPWRAPCTGWFRRP